MKVRENFQLPYFFPEEENKRKVEWIACAAWFLKELINQGKLKGFDNDDAKRLKLINKGYNMAFKKSDSESWNYFMMTDELAEGISDKAFRRLKLLYSEICEK